MCRNSTYSVVFCAGMLCIASSVCLANDTGTKNDSLSSAAAKLREIEAKAARHDFAVRKNEVLEEDVAKLKNALVNAQDQIKDITNRYSPGRLNDLERKSLAYGYLKEKVEYQDKKVRELERQLAEEKCLTTLQAEEIQKLRTKMSSMDDIEANYQADIRALKNTINQLRLGNFEYYTVQRDGETISEIAGLEMIYGDPTKSEQIRQANVGSVEDIENLKAGEVLIIPRFRASGSYLW